MKKFLKILGALIVLILIALIAIPYFYKDEIEQYIKDDINKSINATFDYEDFSLSLIKNFPNLNISLQGVSVIGIDDFEGVRLVDIGDLGLTLDAKKVFLDKNFEINKIHLDQFNLNILINKDGKANYDITKASTETESSESSPFELKLKSYTLSDSNIKYHDLSSGMLLDLKKINHQGDGKITDQSYLLNTGTEIETASFRYGTQYLNKARIQFDSSILIEESYMKYSFTDPQLKVNKLDISFDKSLIWLKENEIFIDFAFNTQNQLKQILSLIPVEYLASIEDVDANGNASFDGMVKGAVTDSSYPAYTFNLNVNNGTIKYPDLPETLQDINVNAKVNFTGGKHLDNTTIDLSNIHARIADNEIDGYLKLNNPMSDPLINTAFKSNIDLEKLNNAVKIPGIKELKGLVDADFKLKGKLSAIENKKFDQFDASGFFNLNNFVFASDSIPETINIEKAAFDVTPQALLMKDVKTNIGANDFNINGKINNYIAYFFNKNEVLKADFNMHSNNLNINDFMSEETEVETSPESETGTIKIPKNIDVTFNATVDNLKYQDMDLKDVKGKLKVLDEKASLSAVFLKTLEGQMKFNGVYDTSSETPKSSFDINMEEMSIVQSANTFTTVDAYAPILKKVVGNFFSDLKINLELDQNMNPMMKTVNATGSFNTANTKLQGIDVISRIGKLVKIDALKNPNIDKIKAKFTIADGVMQVRPFDFKLNGMKSAFSGSVNLDKQINFVLDLDIPREKLGSNPNAILESAVGKLADLGFDADLGKIIKMKFSITGDYNNPKIRPMLAGFEGKTTTEIITEVVTEKVEEVIEEKVEEVREEAKKQAAKIMATAQQQADALISKAEQAGNEVRKQAKTQGDKLIAQAKNPIAKFAAKETAKKINKKADKTAKGIVAKAKVKANKLLATAQVKADKLLETKVN